MAKPQVIIDLEEYNLLLEVEKKYKEKDKLDFLLSAILVDYLNLEYISTMENSSITRLKKEHIEQFIKENYTLKVIVKSIDLEGRGKLFKYMGAEIKKLYFE